MRARVARGRAASTSCDGRPTGEGAAQSAAQPRILALDLGDARGERGIAHELLLECLPALGRELAVGVRLQVVVDVGVRTHVRDFIARS
jgi:hypothetical protein